MADSFDRVQLGGDQETGVRSKPAAFHEVSGEEEADAVRDAFLRNAGPDPASLASSLIHADPASRIRVVRQVQRLRGNAYVQRIMSESHPSTASLGRGSRGRLVGLSQSDMVAEVLQRKGAGNSLPEGTRQTMESHFNANLEAVRVHTDGEAAALSRELNADAFTVGSHIFLAEGTANMSTREGQALLAHELTHVGQQTGFGDQSLRRLAEADDLVQRQSLEEEEEEVTG
ncbi:MAG: DUF4157 domain-containing protein [Chloroflexi bacterium]|nr:DUF4157 domain-containing protein [Chloroflexota bacterium]